MNPYLIYKHFTYKIFNPLLISLFIIFFGAVGYPIIDRVYHSVTSALNKYMNEKSTAHYILELNNKPLVLTIPQFSVGISGFNEVDWGEVNIVEAIDKTFERIKSATPDDNITIRINMYYFYNDQYGNNYVHYRIYELMTVTVSEVRKYKNSSYFERKYDIINRIKRLPFEKSPIKEISVPCEHK